MARVVDCSGIRYTEEEIKRLSRSKFDEFLEKNPKAKARWEGSNEGLNDTSGSAMDFSMATMLKGAGFSRDELEGILADWPHGSGGGKQQGARYFDRLWERCGRGADDSEVKQEAKDSTPKQQSVASKLVGLALGGGIELWHDPEKNPWATLNIENRKEHHPARSKAIRRYLVGLYFEQTEGAPSSEAIQAALNVLEARAVNRGKCHPVFVRIASYNGNIYLDLANDQWQVIEITPSGWQIVSNPPVRFWRPRGLLPLPAPEKGGKLSELRRFINCDEEGFIFIEAWLVGAVKHRGPYAILNIEGEAGAGKSLLCRLLIAIIDPRVAPLRRPPREERDLFIAATNGWCLGFDNLSGLPDWLSDTLCVVATGGGLATRELYSDREETLLDAQRPVLVNGIDNIGRRDDYRDRCLRIFLPKINEQSVRDEAPLLGEFEIERPKLLGALLDATVAALKHWDTTKLEKVPTRLRQLLVT